MTRYKLKDFDFIEQVGAGGIISPELSRLGEWDDDSHSWLFSSNRAFIGNIVFVKDGVVVDVVDPYGWCSAALEKLPAPVSDGAEASAEPSGTAPSELQALRDRVKALEGVLAWYGEQVRRARSISPEGGSASLALANDGGDRARITLRGAP